MTWGTSPAKLPLAVNDPELLLEQLQAGGRAGELGILVNDRYPHCSLLRSYRHAEAATRAIQFECIKLMVAAKAPIDHGRHSLISTLITYDWNEDTPALNRALGQLYLDNGYVDVEKPLPGSLPSTPPIQGWRFSSGMSPVAAAISYDHLEVLELLLDAGASEELGPVIQGGDSRQAADYAQEMGATRCLTLFNARAMSRAITTQAASAPLESIQAPRRRAGI